MPTATALWLATLSSCYFLLSNILTSLNENKSQVCHQHALIQCMYMFTIKVTTLFLILLRRIRTQPTKAQFDLHSKSPHPKNNTTTCCLLALVHATRELSIISSEFINCNEDLHWPENTEIVEIFQFFVWLFSQWLRNTKKFLLWTFTPLEEQKKVACDVITTANTYMPATGNQ